MIRVNGRNKMEVLNEEVLNAEIEEIAKIWPVVSKVVSVIHTEEEYEYAVKVLDKLIDMVGEDEDHPLASLMETIGALIEDYEDRHYPEPIGCLKYLMEEHNLKQRDLKELGSQGVVSEILNGKRKLTIRQVKALSKRFNISPAVFIEDE
jgi:HTH-type transcriptional regulator/antitoxin HigA